MDIDKLLEQLDGVIWKIEDIVPVMDDNAGMGMQKMPELMAEIEKLLPDWFFFIEQTEIGSKEMVLNILQDIMEAMAAADGVLLTDALVYGLQGLMVEYCDVIKEALNEE